MGLYISAVSIGFSRISPYDFGGSGRAAPFIAFTQSSSTSIGSYWFCRKVFKVHVMSQDDIIMYPWWSLILRMVLSVRLCCIRRVWYVVRCSPSCLSASLLTIRAVFSLSQWSLTIFAFRRFIARRFKPLVPVCCIRSYVIHNNISPSFLGHGIAQVALFGVTDRVSFYNIVPTICLGQGRIPSAFSIAPIVIVISTCIECRWGWYCCVSIGHALSAGWVYQRLVADKSLGGLWTWELAPPRPTSWRAVPVRGICDLVLLLMLNSVWKLFLKVHLARSLSV